MRLWVSVITLAEGGGLHFYLPHWFCCCDVLSVGDLDVWLWKTTQGFFNMCVRACGSENECVQLHSRGSRSLIILELYDNNCRDIIKADRIGLWQNRYDIISER